MLKDANSTWLIATQLLSARARVNVPINFKNYFRQHGLPVVKYTDLKCQTECLHVCTRIRPLSQHTEHCINNHSDGSHSVTPPALITIIGQSDHFRTLHEWNHPVRATCISLPWLNITWCSPMVLQVSIGSSFSLLCSILLYD